MAKLPPMSRPLLTLGAAFAVLASALATEAPNNEDSLHKLRVEKFVMPEFPDFVRSSGNNRGMVTAAIGRDAEGYVTDVLVLSSSNAQLSRSVVDAVRKWKFARPGNLAPMGQQIFPIAKFLFSAKGIAVVSALTGSLASKDRDVDENSPVILPSFADLDTVPKALNHPMPRFTGTLAARVAGGTATVKFFVDEDGKVRVPVVTECTAPELGLAALAAVEQWTFEPPRANGHSTIALETGLFTFGPASN